jgi:ATP-dependent Clp protease, protease subunit
MGVKKLFLHKIHKKGELLMVRINRIMSFGLLLTLYLAVSTFTLNANGKNKIVKKLLVKDKAEKPPVKDKAKTPPVLTKAEKELKALKMDKERLVLNNILVQEKQKRDIMPSILEKKRLEIKNALSKEKLKSKVDLLNSQIVQLKFKLSKFDTEYKLALNKQKSSLLKLEMAKNQMAIKKAIEMLKLDNELASMGAEKRKIDMQNAILQGKNKLKISALKFENEKEKLKSIQENQKLKFEMAKFNFAKMKLNQQLQKKLNEIKLKNQFFTEKTAWRDKVQHSIAHPMLPLDGKGGMRVSDRRIALDGVILSGSGKYIAERVNFYNNQSEKEPIFIIISSCPGGSVLAGERIIRAMESSKAPVYVVVKTFAASMAAIITTRAKRSFAYPNALILHHQMSGFAWGNQTQMDENLKFMKRLEKRVLGPVAKKMGLTLEQFRKKMYKNNSNGNWLEFADVAVKNKWVDQTIEEIREDGYIKRPTGSMPKPWWYGKFEEKKDSNGRPFIKLPRLGPCDYYFIHNPDKYYK